MSAGRVFETAGLDVNLEYGYLENGIIASPGPLIIFHYPPPPLPNFSGRRKYQISKVNWMLQFVRLIKLNDLKASIPIHPKNLKFFVWGKFLCRILSRAHTNSKALHYIFLLGNSLSKPLRNLTKVNESSLTKIITSFSSFHKFFNCLFERVYPVLTKLTIKNLLLTKLTTENLINLLFSKFKLS